MPDAPPHRRSARFLAYGAVTLFFKADPLETALASLRAERFAAFEIDCSGKARFLRTIADALRWDVQFSYCPLILNRDARDDALRRIPGRPTDHAVLVLRAFHGLVQEIGARAEVVLDILAAATWRGLLQGRQLPIFVQTSDPRFATGPLGGQPARWNQAELRDTSRGLGGASA